MTVNETTNYTQPPTIYPAPYYPIYKAWQTVGGWVVVYLADRYTMRPTDGGRIHKSRQNAYNRADRLNHPLKYALKKTRIAEAEYGGDYTACAQKDEGFDADDLPYEYSLSLRQGAMPPFETKFFGSFEELEPYVNQELPHPLRWYKVMPE